MRLRAVTLIAAVFAIVFLLLFFVSGNRETSELQQARKRVADLRADIARLDAENARLHAEIESVQRSTYAVERIAREDLGMSKPGEIVYMLPKR
jgi:cell division protein FtsL